MIQKLLSRNQKGVLHGLIDIDLLKLRLGLPGKLPQVIHDARYSVIAFSDQIQSLSLLPIRRELFHQDMEDRLGCHEGIVQLMSHTRYKLTESPHLGSLYKASLGGLEFRLQKLLLRMSLNMPAVPMM